MIDCFIHRYNPCESRGILLQASLSYLYLETDKKDKSEVRSKADVNGTSRFE